MAKIGRRAAKKKACSNQGARLDLKKPPTRNQDRVDYSEEPLSDVADVEAEDNDVHVLDMNRAIRLMICCMFERDYNGKVDSKSNVVRAIRERTKLSKDYGIKRVIEDYLQHKEWGVQYKGDRVVGEALGRKPILATNSIEAQITADSIEMGASLKLTHVHVNMHRQEEGLPSVTFSSVYSLVKRLKPKTQKVRVHRQGSTDVDSKWARARLHQAIQLLLRYGVIDFDNPTIGLEEVLGDYYNKTQPIPSYFDKTKLTMLSPYQQADWDESHRECVPGEGLGNPKRTTRLIFPRDANGKIDLVGGKYDDNVVTMTRVKYNDETRKCLGLAMVKPIDPLTGAEGPVIGRRLKSFDYTGKVIKSIKDFSYLRSREIARVKSLTNGSNWIDNPRQAGKIYLDDDVQSISGIAKAKAAKLKLADITDVSDLIQLETEDEVQRVAHVTGLSPRNLWTWVGWAQSNIVESNAPEIIDHRKEVNPYLSRFGDQWEEEIDNASLLKPFVCITTMVEHIYEQTKVCFADTKYKDNFMFYHDALNFMTSDGCRSWMREKGYLKHWILPEQQLLYDQVDLKSYRDRPVGNSPELNALDNSCNKDIHEVVDQNVLLTLDLAGGPDKFSLRTPSEAAEAYKTIFEDKAPRSERIIEDRSNIINSLLWIVKMKGTVVADSDLRKDFFTGGPLSGGIRVRDGHRRMTASASQEPKKRGGARKRKLKLDDYGASDNTKGNIHPRAMKVSAMKVEISKALNDNSKADDAHKLMEGIEFKQSVKAKIEKLTSSSNTNSY